MILLFFIRFFFLKILVYSSVILGIKFLEIYLNYYRNYVLGGNNGYV